MVAAHRLHPWRAAAAPYVSRLRRFPRKRGKMECAICAGLLRQVRVKAGWKSTVRSGEPGAWFALMGRKRRWGRFERTLMKLPAHKSGQFVGWLSLSEKQSFAWALRIEVSAKAAVTVPVRVENRDRGWTHYHYADLTSVPAYQIQQLVYSGHLQEAANQGDARHGAAA